MINPQSMVVINLIFSFALFLSIVIYLKVFPKKKVNYLYLLILISILPLISIFRPGTYESGDLSINAIKTISFYQNLLEGNLIPRWAGELNSTYGYPLFVFTYPLPYYLASLIHFIGFGFINSIKVLLIVSYVLSGVFMYYFLKAKVSDFASFAGSIFYLFTPYHLIDMHFRVAIGEMVAFSLIPLILYLTDKMLKKYSRKLIFFSSVAISLLLLSHQAISLIFIPFLVTYVSFFAFIKNTAKAVFVSYLSIFFGLLLSSFYIVPLLYYSAITHQARIAEVTFTSLKHLIVSPWILGLLYQGPMGELVFPVGFVQIIILFIAVYFVVKNKIKNVNQKFLIFYIISFLILIFLITPYSRILWENIPFIKNFQFSYRVSLLSSFIISTIAALVLNRLNKKLGLIFVFFAIGLTLLNWGNRRNIPEITDEYLKEEAPISSARGEGLYPAMPYWTNPTNPFIKAVPQEKIKIIKGSGKIEEVDRTNTVHTYRLALSDNSLIQENTLFFPGWKAYLNGEELKILNRNPMTFFISKGSHNLRVVYEETKLMKFSNILSILTFIALFLFTFSKGLGNPRKLSSRS